MPRFHRPALLLLAAALILYASSALAVPEEEAKFLVHTLSPLTRNPLGRPGAALQGPNMVMAPSGVCSIYGDSQVLEGPAHAAFGNTDSWTAPRQWSITGNGTIVGASDGLFLEVLPGPVTGGSFRLDLTVQASPSPLYCSKTVSVIAAPPSRPGLNDRATFFLHLLRYMPHASCAYWGPDRCDHANTRGALYPDTYFAVLLIGDGYTDGAAYSGIGEVQLGIDYDSATGVGVDIYTWVLCATVEFPGPGWPQAGSGNRILWDGCHCQRREPAGTGTGVMSVMGYFYLGAYTPDTLRVTPNPLDGIAKVIDCAGYESILAGPGVARTPSPLGTAVFSAGGTVFGYNPCEPTIPVVPATWSQIKTLYR